MTHQEQEQLRALMPCVVSVRLDGNIVEGTVRGRLLQYPRLHVTLKNAPRVNAEMSWELFQRAVYNGVVITV